MSVRGGRWLAVAPLVLAALLAGPGGVRPATAQGASPSARPPTCLTDAEPNDTPEQAATLTVPACIEGTLPEGDQDIWLWTVSDADAQRPWTFTIDGPDGTVTGAQVLPITSDVGVSPITAGGAILAASHGTSDAGPVVLDDVLLPAGRFVLGVSRSASADDSPVLDTRYRLDIQPGDPLPPALEQEPNDDASTATPLTDLFSIAGDLQGSYDYYRWTLSDDLAGVPLELRAAGPLGAGLTLTMTRPDGTPLKTVGAFETDARGVLTLSDLMLAPGEYVLQLSPYRDTPLPYRLEVARSDVPDADPEPNDDPAIAAPLDPSHLVMRGRLTQADTRDRFLLTVDQRLADLLLDIRLIARDGPARDLCLETTDGQTIQCHPGDPGATLTGLHLAPGPYVIKVSGDAAPASMYLLRVDGTSAPASDFEAEPNDDGASATPMSVGGPMSGTFDVYDRDVFRVTVGGEVPQLWQMDVTGDLLDRVAWVDPDLHELASASSDTARTSVTLTDLYLIPGDHWFRVDGSAGGDYRFAFTALGPPDPNSEIEPNNESLNAERIGVGDRRTGRLPNDSDWDTYRFTVDTRDHIRLTLTPPGDGVDRMIVQRGPIEFADIRGETPGAPMVWDGMLEPGDVEVALEASTPSSGRYTLQVERLDPFARRDDQEPNDAPEYASALPASLRIEGAGAPGGDTDWYALGSLPNGGDLHLTTTGAIRVGVSDGSTDLPIDQSEEGAVVATALPAGVPLWLRVQSSTADPYTIELDPGQTGLAAAVAPPPPLAATVSVAATPGVVAAFRDVGQTIGGVATISNPGTDDLSLAIDATTSDHHWTVTPDAAAVEVPGGGSVEVPLDIRVLPDAGAGQPVRLSVRVRDAAGAQATGATDVTTDPDAEPVEPWQAWSVPQALLGGLDVASAALGGTPVAPVDPDGEAQLHDGVTPSGSGYRGYLQGAPVTLTVDLAGDAPLPVAGTVLNPLGARDSMSAVPRSFTLLLSDDGATWAEALHGELTTLDMDQPFVLPQPVPARFAQLRIESTWGGTNSPLTLGEWKVIAAPGAVPDAMPSDIGDPVRGGHVVWMWPQASSQAEADRMLTDDPTDYPQAFYADPGTRLRWVTGFQDDRQALIDRLEWHDPTGTDPKTRMRRVDVEVSTTSPIGPWAALGTWDLDRADDGSVAPFVMPPRTWARFIRFTGSPVRKDAYTVEVPALLAIVEHPADDAYRSILGEWGESSPVGPRDLLEPPDLAPVVDADGDDDTPERARALASDTTARDRVHRAQDVDWYAISVPDGQNSVTFTVAGEPSVGVALTMIDPGGQPVAMTFGPGDVPGTVEYQANVTPGTTYRVRVEQPPFSAVFTFDTSGSMGTYLPFVMQAMRTYTGGVVKGEEQALIIPFEEDPLLKEWSDDPYRLQDAMNRYVLGGGSSGAEAALLAATKALAGREGARAVLTVTDAETSSYQKNQELWETLDSVRPMVFAVHVGADSDRLVAKRFMQDWAMAAGGHYQYALSHGEMDQAFDRMASWLRRPAVYSLRYATSEVEVPPPPPGTLSVEAPARSDGSTSAVVGKGVAIEVILDTSGSMLKKAGGRRRIDIAKDVLRELVTTRLPEGLPVAIRVLGDRRDRCGTRLAVPLGPLDPQRVTALVDPIEVVQEADTPLAAAIGAVSDDLAAATGTRILIVITDSEEVWPNRDLCGRDPARAIRGLRHQGIDARVHIVGFGVRDRAARAQLRRWARLGGGSWFDARDARQLADAVRQAVSAPFQVFAQDGSLVATGIVGGPPVKLPPGIYRLVVMSDPQAVYEGVVIESKGSVTVTLPLAGDQPGAGGSPAPGASPGPQASPAPAP